MAIIALLPLLRPTPAMAQVGSAAAPVYSFGNGSGTGLYSPVANSIGLAVAGSAALNILPGGLVGVGTATPQAALDISSPGTAGSAVLVPRDSVANRPSNAINGMIRYASDSAKFEVYQSGVWQNMLGGAAASVPLSGLTAAVGTSSIDSLNYGQTWNWSTATTQTALLRTANALTTGSLESLTSSNAGLNSASGILNVANSGTSTSGMLARFQANATNGSGVSILTNGYVGVGISAPTALLDVITPNFRYYDAAFKLGSASFHSVSSTATYNGLMIGSNYDDNSSQISSSLPSWFLDLGGRGTFGDSDAFTIRRLPAGAAISATNAPAVFKVTAAGNVGIGTTLPYAGLDISLVGTSSSAILLPRDTVANRPAGLNGMLRYNTSAGAFEFFQSGAWVSYGTGAGNGSVTSLVLGTGLVGGTITSSGTINVNVGTAGGQVAQLGSNAQLLLASGSAATPTYSFANGAGTGWYSPGVGTAALSTVGTARLLVDSSGNVGVGTSAPAYTVDVNGNVRFSTDIISSLAYSHGALSGNGFRIGIQGGTYTYNYLQNLSAGTSAAPLSTVDIAGNLAVGTYANSVAAPTNGFIVSGNVGIGVSSPTSPLEVKGAIVSDSVANSVAYINFGAGNSQITSVNATTINVCGLKDGGAYTLVLTGIAASTTVTVAAYPTYASTSSCTGTAMQVDLGAGASTFTTAGNTNIISFVYFASRGSNGTVYGVPAINYSY